MMGYMVKPVLIFYLMWMDRYGLKTICWLKKIPMLSVSCLVEPGESQKLFHVKHLCWWDLLGYLKMLDLQVLYHLLSSNVVWLFLEKLVLRGMDIPVLNLHMKPMMRKVPGYLVLVTLGILIISRYGLYTETVSM